MCLLVLWALRQHDVCARSYGPSEHRRPGRADRRLFVRLLFHLSLGSVWMETRKAVTSVEAELQHMDSFLRWLPQKGVGKDFDDVPESIGAAASEVHSCLSIKANRAAIALGRAVVEATAKDKGITKGNLQNKIDALAEKGLIREHTREVAHQVRLNGNEVAH